MTKTTTRLLLTALLAAAGLAGCVGDEEPSTRFTVDFGGQRANGEQVLTVDVPFDADARPASRWYRAHNATAPDFHSAFDQLDQSLAMLGVRYEANYHPEYRFFLASIDGAPTDLNDYWALEVNGKGATLGMSDLELHEGDDVRWRLVDGQAVPTFPSGSGSESGTSNGAGPRGRDAGAQPAPLLTYRMPEPGVAEQVTVTGTLAAGATLQAQLVDGSVLGPVAPRVDGTSWSVTVAPPPGHSTLRLIAEAETGAEEVLVPLVRLATATMQVVFTAYPTHAPIEDVVTYDPEAFASAPQYENQDMAHPGTATVHDLMVTWSNATGMAIGYTYFGGLGFSPCTFDGVGQCVSSAAPPYWCYRLNGESAEFGISLQAIAPGDVVRWEYGSCMV